MLANLKLRWCGWPAVALHRRTDKLACYLGRTAPMWQIVPRTELTAVVSVFERMPGRNVNGFARIFSPKSGQRGKH